MIDIGLADTPMPLQLFDVAGHGAVGSVPQPNETYLNGGAAYYQVYRTLDGRHAALGAIEPKFWAAFCMAADRPDWVARQAEKEPQHHLIGDVAALIGSLPLDACMARFGPADCCFSPVLDLGEALASPHYRERGLVRPAADGALQALFPARIDGVTPPSRPKLRPADPVTRFHEETGTPWPTQSNPA